MNEIVKRIKKEFSLNPDLIVKEIRLNLFHTIYILFLETLSGSDKVNDYVLKPLINKLDNKIDKKKLNNFLAGPNTVNVKEEDQIEFYLTNGFTIIILDNEIYAIETKADLTRSIAPNEVQMSINGPKDSFTENYQINIGLIKRRIKSSKLKVENRFIGRLTNTVVGVLYVDNITDKNMVDNVLKKLESIDIDGIIDSSSIAYFLDGENKTSFPTVKYTERPDEVVTEILRGKVAIVVDTSPFVLIIPSFFIDFVNPNADNYSKSKNINYIKFIRILTFIIAMLTPGIYNALLSYNPESIPLPLLVNFLIQREGVPFPLVVEILIMLIICDVLKESDLRFPSKFGSAISILGAIILGQAAVDAGIVSPVVIIIIAVTFIASLGFNEQEMSNALRYYCLLFLFLSSLFGLYGIYIGILYFLISICSIETFEHPYFAPLAPFNKVYFKNTVIKGKIQDDTKRSSLIVNKNFTKKESNK